MTRICVIIGEGKSEKSFLQSLIAKQFAFAPMQDKNCIVFRSTNDQEIYWVFPSPSYGPSHKGGYKTLQDKDVYMKSKIVLQSLSYIYGSVVDLHYFILTDTDNCNTAAIEQREEKMFEAMDASGATYKSRTIHFARREIEAWFIAGLTEEYPYLKEGSNAAVKKLLLSIPEDLVNPKELLDDVLDENSSGNREIIGHDFGEYINIEEACKKSASFKLILDNLRKLQLL